MEDKSDLLAATATAELHKTISSEFVLFAVETNRAEEITCQVGPYEGRLGKVGLALALLLQKISSMK